MSANRINIALNCRRCGAPLTIAEMHFFADVDGKANCDGCERRWMEEVEAWRNGERDDFPTDGLTETKQ